MRYRLLLIPFAAVLFLGYRAQAQNHPNLEKGFAADKMYQFGDVDHVNLFNGNVALTIPVGGSLPVSDHLSLSLTLVYNSKLWQAKETRKIIADQLYVFSKYSPERTSNSGFGWTVSLGRLIDPSEVDVNKEAKSFLYQAPDGSESAFYATLHKRSDDPLPPPIPDLAYTRDNTYLRLYHTGANWTIESPDGTTREFESYTDTYTRWRLIQIRDRFGNHIDINYSTPQQWRITDQHNHLTIVHFGFHPDVDGPYQNSVSSIEVPTQGGGTTSYVFNYGTDQFVATAVCGQQDVDPDTPVAFKVPFLRSLSLPDGTSYSFTYTGPIADTIAGLNTVDDRCHAGEIASVTLPTTGKITYAYQEYELPTTGCPADSLAQSSGVYTRLVQDPLHTGNDQKWQYGLSLVTPVGEPDILCPPGGQHTPAPPTRAVNTVTVTTGGVGAVDGVVEQKTRYHFSVWGVRNRTASDGTTARDFGLPFARQLPTFGSRFLSSEVLDSADNPLRQTYVNYQYDYGTTSVDQFDSNRRVTGSRTVFYDDDEVTTNWPFKHYVDNDSSDYDGVGHYRVTTTSGDLTGIPRTVTTAYNTVDSTVNPNALSTGTYDSSSTGGTFVTPSVGVPWVLNLYPTTTVQEGSGTAVQEFCFNPATGFLNGTRKRAGVSRAPADLVAVFDNGTSGGVMGAMISEKDYGGDFTPLTADPSTSLCDSLANPGPIGYDIRHSYSNGVRATSQYFSNNATVGFKFLDRTIDLSTGLVTHSRDSAGIDTIYNYDTSRRLLTATTGSDAQIGYVYTNPTTSAGASVTISQASATSGTPQVAFQYDGFGRLTLQSHTLPSTTSGVARWAYQSTQYDAMGRKSSVSESEETPTPSHRTTFTGFDRFSRPGTVTKPDGSATTFLYHGVRETERTSLIRTGTTDAPATTKEFYDLHGRLYEVREPGNNTVTDYTYDVGGRLHTSSSAGSGTTQLRTFTYDNRGFLLSETHPELGQNGNGTTTYENYDARGNAHRKLTGSANGLYDIRFTYDSSGRLTYVYDYGGSRELKRFVFGTSNDPQLGKLTQAIRTNHLAAGDVAVTETYHYQSTSGRPSDRQTDITSGGVTLQSYKQLFSYDDLGSITRPGYPYDCISASCAGVNGITGATYEYKDGSLSKIPGYASSISYVGNGMTSAIAHENGVTDTITPDASGLPRPASIAITGWSTSCAAPAAPVITAAAQVCASSTNNAASVPANGSVQFQWSISGGQITSSTTGNAITYSAGSTSPVTLSVTASNTCGAGPAGTRNVTVAALPTATVSGSGPLQSGSRQIQAALTGTASWSVTWSDGVTLQSSSSPQFRTVTAAGTYSVTSVSDANCTNPTSNGSSAVVTANSLPAPVGLIATTQDANTRVVHLLWTYVAGATGYRIERTTCLSCGWATLTTVSGSNTYDDTANASALPVAYLYRIIATGSGSADSPPSPIDYATTATTLFPEPIGSNGVTPIRGIHTQELRRAIDALRYSAGLQPYMTPAYPDGWPDYNAPTGIISAAHVVAMRTALDDAVFHLFGVHMSFNGEVPTSGHGIYAYQFNQLRTGVK